jgi:hypothetical protein
VCWAFDPSRVPVRLVAPRAVAFLPTACLRSALPRFTFFSERSTCTSRVIDPAHTALVLIVSLTQVLVRSRARHCHPGACYRTHCLRTAWIGPFLSNAVPVLLCVRAMSRSFIFPSPERRSPASLPFFLRSPFLRPSKAVASTQAVPVCSPSQACTPVAPGIASEVPKLRRASYALGVKHRNASIRFRATSW